MKKVMVLGIFLVFLVSCKPIEIGQVIQWPGLPPVVITSPKVDGEGDLVKLRWETTERFPLAFVSGPAGTKLGNMEKTEWYSYSLNTKAGINTSQLRVAVKSNGAIDPSKGEMLPVYRGKDLPKNWEVSIEKGPLLIINGTEQWGGWRIIMKGPSATLDGELCKILDTGSPYTTEQSWMTAGEKSNLRKLSPIAENEGVTVWEQIVGFDTKGNPVNQVSLGWQGPNLTLLGAEPLQGLFRWSQVLPEPNLPADNQGKLLVQNLDYEVLQSDDPRIQAAPAYLQPFNLLSKEVNGDSMQLHVRWADGSESYILAPNPEDLPPAKSNPTGKVKTTWGHLKK